MTLKGWTKQMGDKVNLQCVLFFHCSQEICTARCLGRGAAGSGRYCLTTVHSYAATLQQRLFEEFGHIELIQLLIVLKDYQVMEYLKSPFLNIYHLTRICYVPTERMCFSLLYFCIGCLAFCFKS